MEITKETKRNLLNLLVSLTYVSGKLLLELFSLHKNLKHTNLIKFNTINNSFS